MADGRHVDQAEALRLLRRRLPGLGAGRAELLGVGWDNTAYLVDGTWLVRFPRRQEGADLTDRELLVLPRLAPLLPLLVPAPEHVGPLDDGEDRTDGYPWRFTVARAVPGVEWWRDPPGPGDEVAAARRLGAALGVLHSPEVGDHLADAVARLPVDPNRRPSPPSGSGAPGPPTPGSRQRGCWGPAWRRLRWRPSPGRPAPRRGRPPSWSTATCTCATSSSPPGCRPGSSTGATSARRRPRST